jgi:S1-C subfamily serine protease
MWWSYAEGVVASSTKSESADSIQVSAPIWMGNSGGGAFDEKGRLVGLCTRMLAYVPNVGFFVPATVIKKFIKED